jgi:hypothetical protein
MPRQRNMPKLKGFAASDELVQRIHDFRRSHEDPQPNESEAIRRLLEVGLSVVEPRYKPSKSSAAAASASGSSK